MIQVTKVGSMDQSSENEQATSSSLESQEPAPSTSAPSTEGPAGSTASVTDASGGITPPDDKPPRRSGLARLRQLLSGRFNIYLLLFVLLLVLVAIVATTLYLHDRQQNQASQSLGGQSLSASDLSELANTGINVGDPKQVLTVQSNAIFAGKILTRGDLEVAGRLTVGSSLSLSGISVTGTSTFDTVQAAKDLSVGGNAAVHGKLTAGSVATSGDASFGGNVSAAKLTTNALALTGDLTLTHHLVIGGSSPSRSNGGALGSGGTSGVSGSDTAGSITINTGSSPSAGCFITVHFAKKYNQTPQVIVTPVGSTAGSVGYYVSRTTTSFTVCGTKPAAASRTFDFDYFVVE